MIVTWPPHPLLASCPSLMSWSTRCDPTNPAPPVTWRYCENSLSKTNKLQISYYTRILFLSASVSLLTLGKVLPCGTDIGCLLSIEFLKTALNIQNGENTKGLGKMWVEWAPSKCRGLTLLPGNESFPPARLSPVVIQILKKGVYVIN